MILEIYRIILNLMNALSPYFKELKTSSYLAFPLMVGLLAQTGMWLINSVAMGRLGIETLAAGALAITAYYLIFVLFFGLINAVGLCVAHAKGATHDSKVTLYFQQGIYLVILITIPMMLSLLYLPYLFTWLKQSQDVVNLTKEFLRGISFGCGGVLGFSLLREFNTALENSVIMMYISLLMLPILALLDYGLAFGHFFLPSWSIFGIGVATSIVQWFMFFIMMFYTFRKKDLKIYTCQPLERVNWQVIRYLLCIGAPLAVTYFFEAGLFNISAILMGWLKNDNALAAHQILLQCVEITFMCFFAFAQTAAVRVSHNMGKKNIIGIRISLRTNLSLGLVIAMIISLIFILWPRQIINIFIDVNNNPNDALLYFAIQFFKVASVFVFFDLLQIIINNVLRGIKDTLIPMLINIGSYWGVGIGSAYYFCFILNMGGIGIWLGLILGLFVTNIALWTRWFYLMKGMKIIDLKYENGVTIVKPSFFS